MSDLEIFYRGMQAPYAFLKRSQSRSRLATPYVKALEPTPQFLHTSGG